MELLYSLLAENYGANALGYLAICFALIAYSSKEQSIFILARSATDLSFALHFMLLGEHLVGYLCLILAAVFVLRPLTPNRRAYMCITITALLASMALSYDGIASHADLVAIIGTGMCFITPMISSNFYMRLWSVGFVTPTWFLYAVMISSTPSMLANIFYMVAGGYGLFRVILAAQEMGEAMPRPLHVLVTQRSRS